MSVQFFVPGKPVAKGRPRAGRSFGGGVRLYTPETTVKYESTVRLFAAQAMAGRAPLEGAVRVAMFIGCEIPASWSKKKQAQAIAQTIHPTGKPDADNCIKAVFDAINAVVWKDDAQVVSLVVDKRYTDRPGVDVVVQEAA